MTAWSAAFPGTLHRYQIAALAGLDVAWGAGARRGLVVLPPGAGKTVVGLEAARRLGHPTLVLSPNTAIQWQWVAQWRAYCGSADVAIGTDRSLTTPITSLTYQAVATFEPDAEVDADGDTVRGEVAHVDRLTDQARALVGRLVELGEVTLVLDECHHLLDVWGRLLGEILDLLPQATVIGLTATPASTLTGQQAELVDQLFGPALYSVSIPAAVRDGRLAPYAELAYLCRPTSAEGDWLASEAERFLELQTDLTDPGFAATAFLPWLDERVSRVGGGEWIQLEKDRPTLSGALLRFHHAGLCALPTGARVREEHRHPPQADDWGAVIGAYIGEALRLSVDPRDIEALARLRRALPSIGFHVSGGGVRRGRSPVDRVLARSGAKARATGEIVAAERRNLGDRLRALVLSDYERATATLPARLVGVIDEEAGSALDTLAELIADPALDGLGIALVTGRTVAGNATAVAAIRESADAAGIPLTCPPGGGRVLRVEGAWSPRQWVPLVTDLFESGAVAVLVGTRGLLGEGWDARSVTTLVDLTAATTPTAVVQTRGRALRVDPDWAQKVAHTWSVVCVDHVHPRGWQDWDRFVRKHDGYLGIDEAGQVVAGVAHVSWSLSPFAPPAADAFDAHNAAMLVRAEDRDRTRDLWQVGRPYEDALVPMVRVRGTGPSTRTIPATPALPSVPDMVPGPRGIDIRPGTNRRDPSRPRARTWTVAALGTLVTAAVLGAVSAPVWALALLLVPVAAMAVAVHRAGCRAVLAYAEIVGEPGIASYAYVVADALLEAGACDKGAGNVRIRVDPDGMTCVDLPGPAAVAFAAALDELLGAPALPRYVIGRPVLPSLPPIGERARARIARSAFRRRLDMPLAVHTVPSWFGVNAAHAKAFATAWHRWIAATDPLFTGSPEGAGLLASSGGTPPVSLETSLRVHWE